MGSKAASKKQPKNFVYSGKTQTSILAELPSDNNPYVSKNRYLYGYDLTELIEKKSFIDTLLLLFLGELPTREHKILLEKLMIFLIDIGPRHPAVKASMVAGVSKSNTEHLLPIGLNVLGGKTNGANEVSDAITFIQQNIKTPPHEVALELIHSFSDNNQKQEGECHLCPGFGQQYGSIDDYTHTTAIHVMRNYLDENNTKESSVIHWVVSFIEALAPYNMGILMTGFAASIFYEIGISPRLSIGLFQILCAPGIFVHGEEQTHKPITAMPMLSDEQHIYTPSKK